MTTTTPQTFRKKPHEIEAMEWDGTAAGATPIINWVLAQGGTARWDEPHDAFENPDATEGYPASPGGLFITTPGGNDRADAGDWIVRSVDGHFSAWKPDIFAGYHDRVQGGTFEEINRLEFNNHDQILINGRQFTYPVLIQPDTPAVTLTRVGDTEVKGETAWEIAMTLIAYLKSPPKISPGIRSVHRRNQIQVFSRDV